MGSCAGRVWGGGKCPEGGADVLRLRCVFEPLSMVDAILRKFERQKVIYNRF